MTNVIENALISRAVKILEYEYFGIINKIEKQKEINEDIDIDDIDNVIRYKRLLYDYYQRKGVTFENNKFR